MNVWRLITHHSEPDQALIWLKQQERIAIGWGDVGDIEHKGYASAKDITTAVKRCYPGKRNAGQGGVNLWDFCHSLKIGDLVILNTRGKRALVMEVTGDYEYRTKQDSFGGYQHQRAAHILPIDPNELWKHAGKGPIAEHNIRWPLIKCREPIDHAAKNAFAGLVP